MTPLADWIASVAQHTPGKAALRYGGGQISYAQLAHRIDELACALAAAGIGTGDIVAWLGLNRPRLLAMLFACARVGATLMPLNWRLAPPEHRAMLVEAAPRLLFVDDPFTADSAGQPIVPPATQTLALGATVPRGWSTWDAFIAAGDSRTPSFGPVAASTPLLLCYTSGSTGRPKGVLLSQDALAANADASVDMHGLTAADRVLTTLPLFHVGGLNIQTTPALRQGCSVSLHARFDPDATFDAIARDRITLTVLVPAQLEALIAHPRWAAADFSTLRMISTGSTTVPRKIIDAVHARGVPLIQVWGATETCPIASCQHAEESRGTAGSAGRAALGVELRIADVHDAPLPTGQRGEIQARGRNLMLGYLHDEAASTRTLEGGWFHSGDSGHLDDQGLLWVDGRIKDMIISGGENVSPAEVEAVLLECPEVAEAAVVGRPDDRWGEVVVAVVAPKPGATLAREQLLGLFEGRLARFKQPKDLLFVDELPRSALGKVRKEDLRRLVASWTTSSTKGSS